MPTPANSAPGTQTVRFGLKATAAASLVLLSALLGTAALAAAPVARDALLAQAHHLRDTQQWPQALQAYQQGRQQFPQDSAFQYGEIYVLADADQTEQAVALATQWLARQPDDADALLLMGYARLRHEGVFAALEYVDRAMQVAGDRPYVVRDYVLTLQRAGLAFAGLEIAQRHPQLFTPAQIWALQADAVAESIRHADLPARSEAERFAVADAALARYSVLWAQWQADPEATRAIHQRTRIDRLQALHARFRMAELVQEYEALVAEGVDIPGFALGNVASAYLYLRQPEQATLLYQRLIASGYMRDDEITRQNQDIGLLYAYADQGDVTASQQSAQPLQQSHPQWRYMEGDAAHIPNPAFLDAQHTATMMDFYAQSTPSAQYTLERMVHAAPNNNNLRTDLAWIYRSRGWPRQAEQTLKVAESYEARGLSLEVGQGLAALDLQEWRQAQQLSADTLTRFPEDRRSQRLARLWQVHNMAQLQVSGYQGLSHNNPVAGGRDFGLETTLYSQPLAYHWRLLAGLGHRSARFDDGKARHNFGRVGLEWRSRDWTVLGEVVDNHVGPSNHLGAGLAVDYSLSDTWSLQAGAQWRARDTSLDALRNGITSNRLDLGLQWRHSERRSVSLMITPSDFSDGNRRWEVLLSGQQRLWTRPTWFVDGGLEVFATRNSRSDVPYYSPRSAHSVVPTLTWNHTLHQRYTTAWTQQASVGLGGLHQRGYGGGAIGTLSYGQRYQANDVFEIGGTLSTLSRPYDGVREREWRVVFDMIFRF